MRARAPIAAVALILAAAGLTGCRTNVGTAASVGGHRISESTVNSYVRPAGASSSLVAQASAQGTTIAPKTVVVRFLVLEQVFRKTLAANKDKSTGVGVPTDAALDASHDKALALLQPSAGATGSAFDRGVEKQLVENGVATKLVTTYLRVQELEYALIERLKLTSPAEVVSTISKAGVPVRINPRYGKWDPAQITLNPAGSKPGYLSLQTVAAASPAAGQAGG